MCRLLIGPSLCSSLLHKDIYTDRSLPDYVLRSYDITRSVIRIKRQLCNITYHCLAWVALWKLIEDYFWWIFVSIFSLWWSKCIPKLYFILLLQQLENLCFHFIWMDRTVICLLWIQIYHSSADFHFNRRKITFKLSSHKAKTTTKPTSPENSFVIFWNFNF